jgi:hypothetical protein
MKPGGGKNKGSAFEREVCRKLTKWATGEEKPEIFWRTSASGAQATMSKKKGHKSKMGGDIMAIDERGMLFTKTFYCECKSYKELRVEDFLVGSGNLFSFWKKCQKEAAEEGKRPLLIFKKNRSKIFVLLYGWEIDTYCGFRCTDNIIYINYNLGSDVALVLFEDFLSDLRLDNL